MVQFQLSGCFEPEADASTQGVRAAIGPNPWGLCQPAFRYGIVPAMSVSSIT